MPSNPCQAGRKLKAQIRPADVVQGVLEGSNVEGVSEITEMIRIHRAHDGVKGFIDKEDERLKRMTRELLAA